MNREIKFRAWTGEMMLNAQDEFRLSFGAEKPELHVHLSDNDWDDIPIESVMQYTGLKDKNGKEIYEGDIVAFNTCEQGKESEHYKQKHICRFYRGVFSIGSGHLYEWSHENGGLDAPLKWRHYIIYGAKNMYMLDFDIEVIGNIYENPELLQP